MDRDKFEDLVFAEYFVRGIQRNPSPPHGPCGALDFIPTNNLTKADLCERDGESYKRPEISAMWFGWQLAYRHQQEATAVGADERDDWKLRGDGDTHQ